MLNYAEKQTPNTISLSLYIYFLSEKYYFVHQGENNIAHIIQGKPSITEGEDI